MNKFKSKKGFTLAELLIVVAIIAVLVAIAVPIFVSSLDNAKKGVFQANQRTLKGLAVTEILSNTDAYAKDTDNDGIWIAKGHWDEKGNITLDSIDNGTSSSEDTEYSKDVKTSENSAVTVVITKADVPGSYT